MSAIKLYRIRILTSQGRPVVFFGDSSVAKTVRDHYEMAVGLSKPKKGEEKLPKVVKLACVSRCGAGTLYVDMRDVISCSLMRLDDPEAFLKDLGVEEAPKGRAIVYDHPMDDVSSFELVELPGLPVEGPDIPADAEPAEAEAEEPRTDEPGPEEAPEPEETHEEPVDFTVYRKATIVQASVVRARSRSEAAELAGAMMDDNDYWTVVQGPDVEFLHDRTETGNPYELEIQNPEPEEGPEEAVAEGDEPEEGTGGEVGAVR